MKHFLQIVKYLNVNGRKSVLNKINVLLLLSVCVYCDKIAGCHISYVTPGEASLSSNESLAKIGSMVKARKRHEHFPTKV